ncbi:MAG: hypothetical protein BZ138_02800 [Methanosphaera sp. rholeuAM270]|nr:MAG: hypothetical protein BZ138_02800 [Methanosphaera sp. rholeuAM270]
MNNHGQITVEYILIMSIIIIMIIFASSTIFEETEKNTILTSAQIGAQIGIDKNAYAMYYNDTFNNYQQNYPKLLSPTELKIIEINMTQEKNEIKLQATLHSNTYLNANEKDIISSRINYYIRKTISETFETENNDLYYENLQINNQKIKTKKVKWV